MPDEAKEETKKKIKHVVEEVIAPVAEEPKTETLGERDIQTRVSKKTPTRMMRRSIFSL